MKTIKSRLILLTAVMLLVVCVSFGVIAIFMSTNTIMHDISTNIEGKAQDAAQIVSVNIDKEISIMKKIAGQSRISDPANPIGAKVSALAEDLTEGGYTRVAFVDMKGMAHYSDGTSKDISDMEYVKTALQGNSTISDTIVSKVDGSVVIAYAVPVFHNDLLVGAIVSIRPAEFISNTIKDINISGSSYAFIVSKAGTVQAHPNLELVKTQYNFITEAKKDPKAAGLGDLVTKMTARKKGHGTYWFKGQDKYIGYAPILGTSWAVGVAIPQSEVMAPINKLKKTFTGITIGLLLLGLLGAWAIGVSMAAPIVIATTHAKRMGSGDFSKDIPKEFLARKDEIGQLGKAFDEMTRNFRGLIGTVVGLAEQVAASSQELMAVSDQVHSASNEIAKSVEDIAEGASGQAKETESGAHQTVELGELIDGETEKLNALETASTEIRGKIHEGLLSADILQKKANETKEATQAISAGINLTNESSSKIGEASNMISAIAGQTNLLALNAAIEAARAGEYGKGFAVVADEIRKLAEQSTESTRVIDSMVKELRRNSQSSVKTMDQVTAAISSQLVSVKETETKYKEIASAVDSSLDLITNLSTSSQQMSRNKVKIIEVMSGLSAIAEENAASSEEVSAMVHLQTTSIEDIANASKNLAELAQELTEASAKFKI